MEMLHTFSIKTALSYGYTTVKKNFGFFALLSLIFAVLYGLPSMPWQKLALLKDCKDLACAKEIMAQQPPHFSFTRILFMIISSIVSWAMAFLFIRVALDLYKTGTTSWSRVSTIFSRTFLRMVGATLLFSFCAIIGLIICIIPGALFYFFTGSLLSPVVKLAIIALYGIACACFYFYLSARICFFAYYLIDKNMGIWQAISASFALTKGVVGKILLTVMLSLLIIFLAILVGGIIVGGLVYFAPSILSFIIGMLICILLSLMSVFLLLNATVSMYYQLIGEHQA